MFNVLVGVEAKNILCELGGLGSSVGLCPWCPIESAWWQYVAYGCAHLDVDVDCRWTHTWWFLYLRLSASLAHTPQVGLHMVSPSPALPCYLLSQPYFVFGQPVCGWQPNIASVCPSLHYICMSSSRKPWCTGSVAHGNVQRSTILKAVPSYKVQINIMYKYCVDVICSYCLIVIFCRGETSYISYAFSGILSFIRVFAQ